MEPTNALDRYVEGSLAMLTVVSSRRKRAAKAAHVITADQLDTENSEARRAMVLSMHAGD
jgi:hypothetical protein